MIQPTYGVVKNFKTERLETRVKAEVNFDPSDDIKKAVSVNAKAFLTSVTYQDGKTDAKAKVVFTLVYLSENGYKKTESETEVSATFPFENCNVTLSVSDAKLLSNKSVAATNVIFVAEAAVCSEHDYLSGGDNVIIKEREEDIDICFPVKDGKHVISDEFDLNFAVREVLTYCACVTLKEVNAGLGRIIFDGEIILTLKALPFSENNDILKERRVIPFRYELDYSDSTPETLACGNAEVTSTNLKIFSDEEKNVCQVSVDITVNLSGYTTGVEKVVFAEDSYVKENLSDLTLKTVTFNRLTACKSIVEKVTGVAGDAPDGGRIVTVMGESLLSYGVKSEDGKTAMEGVVRCDVVFKNSDNGISTQIAEVPYALEIANNCKTDSVKLALTDLTAKNKNGQIELEATVNITYKEIDEKSVSFVENITEGEKRSVSQNAISVFIPTRGDGVWEIAKQFGSDEEEIRKLNPDLSFPLTGDERIVIYRQKI